jgi:hypothetical protein
MNVGDKVKTAEVLKSNWQAESRRAGAIGTIAAINEEGIHEVEHSDGGSSCYHADELTLLESCSGTIKFESDDDWDAWFNAVMTALPLRDGNASSAIGVADKVLRALQERRLEEPVPYVPVDLLDEGLPVYLAERVSVALQRLPTDLGTEWTGKRREDLAVHQGVVADAIAEALKARCHERSPTGPPLQSTRVDTRSNPPADAVNFLELLGEELKPKAIPFTPDQLRAELQRAVDSSFWLTAAAAAAQIYLADYGHDTSVEHLLGLLKDDIDKELSRNLDQLSLRDMLAGDLRDFWRGGRDNRNARCCLYNVIKTTCVLKMAGIFTVIGQEALAQ